MKSPAIKTSWRSSDDATVATDDGTRWQVEFAPPNDVGEIAEGTNHGDASALVDLREWVSKNGDFDTVQRCADCFAKEWFVSIVIGVSNECNACG
jgi:hypothetical protein